ncbi:MAG TPA: PAS domain-containing protein, partial [Anaerolineae bacterium]
MSIALRLVEPTSSLQGLEARLNARLLAGLLLALLYLVLLGALVIMITGAPTNTSLSLWGAAVSLTLSYTLSRTRHYRLGAALSIFIFSLIPYATIAIVATRLTSEFLFLSLSWLSLPILLTSLFFSTRITTIYAVLINLSMLLIPALIPDVDWRTVYPSLGLVLTVSVLVVVLMYHRKQIERSRQATLTESEARYRRLAENAQDIIYRYNFTPQRHMAYINPVVSGILGYSPDEFYADPDLFFNLIHPNDRPALLSAIAQGVPLAAPLNIRWMRKDRTLAWIEDRNVPINDA